MVFLNGEHALVQLKKLRKSSLNRAYKNRAYMRRKTQKAWLAFLERLHSIKNLLRSII